MKINFIYKPFPTTWTVKYGNNKEQLKENILKHKKAYITAFRHKKKLISTSIYFDEDYFSMNILPYSCSHLKVLEEIRKNLRGYTSRFEYFKLLKKQGKKEYELFIIENIKSFIPKIEEQIDELNITVYTNIEELLNG